MKAACRAMVLFEREKLANVKEWCAKHGIAFSEFVRKAVDDLYERVCNK